ncbi:MAG TPA: SMC-Scp complex subunit ScpB [Acidobacteriota bacterium]|nr:SMC-Scp complex subunit ScpB [Acidobacteriota bacterium]
MIDETTVVVDHDTNDQIEVPEATALSADERFLAAVEALLFAAHEPLPAATLCAVNGHAVWSLDQVIGEINERLASGGHPMRVRKVAGGYQMHLLPDFAAIVEAHLMKTRTQRLSRAGLETLAIVAYRQPCTTPEIEHVRGVACDGVLRTLLERNLITIKGRSDAPGRPLLYVTTNEFLRYFGLNSLDELPAEEQLRELMAAQTPSEGDPLAAYAAATRQESIFGTVVIRRGPESGGNGEPGRFVIEEISSASNNGEWEEAGETTAATEPEEASDNGAPETVTSPHPAVAG